jgi:endonuclease/exonuclease/phosphatase family metal-dependent hydrolase
MFYADRFLEAFGEGYKAFFDRGGRVHRDGIVHEVAPQYPDPVIIYNTHRLFPAQFGFTKLPLVQRIPLRYRPFMRELAGMTLVERLVAHDDVLTKYAALNGFTRRQIAPWMRLAVRGSGDALTVSSVHLETWGGNDLRERQLRAVTNPHPRRHLLCGDTNLYWMDDATMQIRNFRETMARAGLVDSGAAATFSPLRSEYAFIRLLGRLRLLTPARLDTIAVTPDLRTMRTGVVDMTGYSDHDMIWAVVETP